MTCLLLVPAQLYPFDIEPLLPILSRAGAICVAEEGTAGGTWGSEIAYLLHDRLWGQLRRPVRLIHSAASVIPTAAHLERTVVLQDATIREAVTEVLS